MPGSAGRSEAVLLAVVFFSCASYSVMSDEFLQGSGGVRFRHNRLVCTEIVDVVVKVYFGAKIVNIFKKSIRRTKKHSKSNI